MVESLESRELLAGDTFAAWQNPAMPHDVNGDDLVSSIDALRIIRDLNQYGSRSLGERAAGEPDSATTYFPDVNGDNVLSSRDVVSVIRALQPAGEGETAQIRLEVTDLQGNSVTTAKVGDQLQLRGYIKDLRDESIATGLFVAYTDVEYDATRISIAENGAITFTPEFPNGTAGSTSVAGLIDEVGAFIAGTTGFGTQENLLFTVAVEATSTGTVTFSSNPADLLPAHETLFFSPLDPLAPEDILYGSVDVTIEAATTSTPDLVAFAQALAATEGLRYWSTSQSNTQAVAQRSLFEDGANYLPIRESLTSAGVLNADATTAEITEVNTWVFPDGTRSVGELLTLEQISQRSGVAIPSASIPFLAELPNVTVTNESPLHIPLDGYDPGNGPLTYTITTDNPDLISAELLEGNRSWRLDMGGYGEMIFEFFEGQAPRATQQFISLTQDGYFDDIIFHRVIDQFVIQGGDPTGTGTGGSDLPDFDDEFHVDLQHNRPGVLSMAKTVDDSNNSQFFVTEVNTQFLDFQHTIFGQLVEGESVREAISNTPTNAADRPLTDVVIRNATVFTDMENGMLVVKSRNGAIGTGNITVTATDVAGNQFNRTFQATIVDDTRNSQPFLADIPELTATPGSTVEFPLDVIDIESNPVFYFVSPNGTTEATSSVSTDGLLTIVVPESIAPGSVLQFNLDVSETNSPLATNRDEQRISLRVLPVEAVASNDAFTILEDSTDVVLDVLGNDALDASATITSVSAAAQGSVSIAADGLSLLYTPTANFNGTDSFTYVATTSTGEATATVTITVPNVDDPPTAVDDVFPRDFLATNASRNALVEDATGPITLPVLLNDTNLPDDVNQELFTITSVTNGTNGTVTTNSLNVAYLPNPDFFGTDTFTYTITGLTSGLSSTATVTVEVADVNDPPIAQDEVFTVAVGQSRTFSTTELVANDVAGPANEADQTLEITAINYAGTGTAVLNNGAIVYTPAAGFTGTETIDYAVTDNGTSRGQLSPLADFATITINVTGDLIAVNDEFEFAFGNQTRDLNVLANDPNPETLELVSVTTPTLGTVEIVGRVLSYRSNLNSFGTDTFVYTVRNEAGETAEATVTIVIGTQEPLAVDDFLTAKGITTLDVLANDVLGQGANGFTISATTAPSQGQIRISNDLLAIVYEPNASYVGPDSFTYTIVDEHGKSDTATVTLTVEAVEVDNNRDPLAFNDVFDVEPDTALQPLNVLGNDTALPDVGETLTIVEITMLPSNGTAVINAAGNQILYTPDPGFEGSDALTYRISDGNGGSDSAIVEITVTPLNSPPVATNDQFNITTARTQILNVLANDIGDVGEVLSIVQLQASSARGTVSISADGRSLLYTPDFSFQGTDTFTYTVGDGTGLTDQATVTVTQPNLIAGSFYAGAVFQDRNDDALRDANEPGIAGVTVVLEGTDIRGDKVRMTTKTARDGSYRFDEIAPGTYVVSQQQPAFMQDGLAISTSSISGGSRVEVTVTDQLIASSDNLFSERGLLPQFAMLDAISSHRGDSLTIVLDGNDLSWLAADEGWDQFASVDVTSDGSILSIHAVDSAGANFDRTVSIANREVVQLVGRSGNFTMLKIHGSTSNVLSPAAVDAALEL